MIHTKYGDMEESLLERKEIISEDENAKTIRTEYWFSGEEVRSDVHIIIKKGLDVKQIMGDL